jgi:hypothetical protein
VNYPDGTKVLVGDRLQLWEGCDGVVACSIDDDEYTPEHSRDHRAYLNTVLIVSSEAGLIHHRVPEGSFELIERKRKP